MKPKELERLSEVQEPDIDAAEEWWKRNAPKPMKDLIQAEPEENV
jgi:hypothetical protein